MAEKNTDFGDLLHEIANDLRLLEAKVESAFPKNEDNEIDYQGHKAYHKTQNTKDEEYRTSRNLVIRSIVAWLAIGILTVIGSALGQTLFHAVTLPATK